MKQEDKDLLLRDLCARLPYGVIIEHEGNLSMLDTIFMCDSISISSTSIDKEIFYNLGLDEFKPYLFPLSSMTEEQKEEYNSVCNKDLDALSEAVCNRTYVKTRIAMPLYYGIDWLIANHFDYRGLIPKGLAIDATDKNIY